MSNEVGGNLIGNAWWSGVRLADLLRQAGPDQARTPYSRRPRTAGPAAPRSAALTDDRNAMLAVAMNGKPLPIDHGFPVRTLVPGLYGYVSACKWVVDMEVTRFDEIERVLDREGLGRDGPGEDGVAGRRAPVGRRGSGGRRDVRRRWPGRSTRGSTGWRWPIDGGAWESAELAGVPNDDTWVQWRPSVDVEPGDHMVRVRATDKDGVVQTGVERDVLPDGATGWHSVDFSVHG